MESPKQRLRESIEALTEQQASRALQWVQHLIETGSANVSAEMISPPPDMSPFADFDPLVVSGEPASELLIADRR